MRPSFISQGIGGIIMFIAIIMFMSGLYDGYITMNNAQIIVILLLLSIALALHGMQHFQEEIYYDFNPLEGKWQPMDKPLR